jgi:hypothetical protein
MVILAAIAAVAAVAAVAEIPAASASSAASPWSTYRYCADSADFFTGSSAVVGVSASGVVGASPRAQDCALGRMAANHVAFLRQVLDWASVEPKPGVYRWAAYDATMAALARHNMSFLPVLFNTPAWDSLAPRHPTPSVVYAPRRATQFADFAQAAAARYGPNGTFWQSNPTLPYFPVRAWQIWNEPNLTFYWHPAPNVVAYTRLLRDSSIAIRSVDPQATIVTAGVPFGSLGSPATSFFAQMYKAGAKGTFNALSLHDYAPTVFGALQRLQILRALMDRYGDSRTALWVTEFGWSTVGPASPYRVGTYGQRHYVTAFMQDVERYRRQLNLGSVAYFQWRNPYVAPSVGSQDFWGLHTGLIRVDGVPFPSLAAFAAEAAKLNG